MTPSRHSSWATTQVTPEEAPLEYERLTTAAALWYEECPRRSMWRMARNGNGPTPVCWAELGNIVQLSLNDRLNPTPMRQPLTRVSWNIALSLRASAERLHP